MDRIRFGRALGYGARHAAKSLAKAVEAAAAPNPARPNSPTAAARPVPRAAEADAAPAQPGTTRIASPRSSFQPAPGAVASRVPPFPSSARRAKTNAAELRRSVWSPLARFSSVVWLQVTGTFFAFVATFLSQGLWKERGALHLPLNSPEAEKLYLHAVVFAVFAYFAVSSFVRAHRRQRR